MSWINFLFLVLHTKYFTCRKFTSWWRKSQFYDRRKTKGDHMSEREIKSFPISFHDLISESFIGCKSMEKIDDTSPGFSVAVAVGVVSCKLVGIIASVVRVLNINNFPFRRSRSLALSNYSAIISTKLSGILSFLLIIKNPIHSATRRACELWTWCERLI